MIAEKTNIIEITNLLQYIGMPAHIEGYYFVREAIQIVYEQPELLRCFMSGVYAEIARNHDTTIKNVERRIRTAIETAWLRGDMDAIVTVFHNTIDGRKGRPTNKEFVALVVDYLKIRYK